MKSTSDSTDETLDLQGAALATGGDEPVVSRSHVATLKELTLRLIREIQSIAERQMPDMEKGFDFYQEVSRFEIDLIRLALLQTGGHQRRAARLLNLKVTTLNSKIKHYNISPADFENSYALLLKSKDESRQYA